MQQYGLSSSFYQTYLFWLCLRYLNTTPPKHIDVTIKVKQIGLLLVFSFICASVIKYASQETILKCFTYDSLGYYLYLPSFFIYNDASHLSFVPEMIWKYNNTHEFYQALVLPSGNYVFGYTMGVAILQLPFFLLGHLLSVLFGVPTDGFSVLYQLFICTSGIFYGLLGLTFLYALLTSTYSKGAALLTLVMLFLGTNFIFYNFGENGMGHAYSFFLFALLAYTFNRFLHQPTTVLSVVIGLSVGMILLIRPTNALVLFPLFFLHLTLSADDIKNRVLFLFSSRKQMLIALPFVALPFLIQMLYWKSATGQFLFNPYAYAGLGFDFLHPHLFSGVFGLYRGFFFYAPIMLLFLPGLLIRTTKSIFPSLIIALYFFVNCWIVYSWKVYDYGGSYGARALIESFVILSIPLAKINTHLLRLSPKRRMVVLVFVSLLCFNNLFQVTKFANSHTSGYNKYELLSNYFTYSTKAISRHMQSLLADNKYTVIQQWQINAPKTLNQGNFFSDGICIALDSISDIDSYLLLLNAKGRYAHLNILKGSRTAAMVTTLNHKNIGYCWVEENFKAQTILGDTVTNEIRVYQNIPNPYSKDDTLKCFVWNTGGNDFLFDSMSVTLIKVNE